MVRTSAVSARTFSSVMEPSEVLAVNDPAATSESRMPPSLVRHSKVPAFNRVQAMPPSEVLSFVSPSTSWISTLPSEVLASTVPAMPEMSIEPSLVVSVRFVCVGTVPQSDTSNHAFRMTVGLSITTRSPRPAGSSRTSICDASSCARSMVRACVTMVALREQSFV